MLLRTGDNPVERIGVSNESEFTIVNNAKAFDILSSGLYTDPIMAVVRELSCNAYDAHVDAGKKDVPFTIHLPSKLEPYFSVKDDGIGLSDEDVRGLYSTYFASTKTQSNDVIGAFGLGSKSPFSYSKAFDVISRWEGTKRTYSVFINEEGVPTIAELAKVSTDEGNGIEVKIAAKSQDHETFRYNTKQALMYFPVKPKVVGYSGFEFDHPEMSESATVTDSYIVERDTSGYNRSFVAVQGNVPYRVSLSQIDHHISSAVQSFVNNHTIVLFFKIGMLDVAANREEVRYDELTTKNIVEAVEVAFNDYLQVIDQEINELTKKGSRWEVFALLHNKFNSSSQLKSTVGGFKFTSKLANDWINTQGKINYNVDWSYHKIVRYGAGNERAVKQHHRSDGYGEDRKIYIQPNRNHKVILNDVSKRSSMRMNTIFEGRRFSSECLLTIIPISDRILGNNGITVTSQQRAAEYKKIVKDLGMPVVKLLSECTDDVEAASGGPRRSGNTFKRMVATYARNVRSKPILQVVAEPDDGGLYIQVDHLRNLIIGEDQVNWTHNQLSGHLELVLKVINYVKGTNYEVTDVFGLTKKVVKAVSTDPNWTDLSKLYARSLPKIKPIQEYHNRISGESNVFGIRYSINKKSFQKMVTKLSSTSKFRTLIEPVMELAKEARDLEFHKHHALDAGDFNQLSSFNRAYGIEVKLETKPYLKKKDFNEYTMLKYVDLSSDDELKNVQEYIELIEQ